MTLLRSMRRFTVVAVFAALLTAFGGMVPASGPAQGNSTEAGMVDCGMCPGGDPMMVASCLQLICGLPAMEADMRLVSAIGPARYARAVVSVPAEWHTIPPVSPG